MASNRKPRQVDERRHIALSLFRERWNRLKSDVEDMVWRFPEVDAAQSAGEVLEQLELDLEKFGIL
jgi:hypothetical protein